MANKIIEPPEPPPPPSPPIVFRPHPDKPNIMQKFLPIITKDENGQKDIEFGDSLGDYRLAHPGEKGDISLYSHKDFMMQRYVLITL